MKCYICSKEAESFSETYVEKVCLECDAKFLEGDIKAREIRKEYSDKHALCPKCGSEPHMTTLAGFALDMSNPEEYKDLNDCTCSICGDKHTAHERVPKI